MNYKVSRIFNSLRFSLSKLCLARQTFYVFVIIEIHSRKLIDIAVTSSPTADFVKTVLRNNLAFRSGPDLIIRDRDPKYGKDFNKTIKELYGSKVIAVSSYSPNLNAYCERVIGSIQRECTDHFLCCMIKCAPRPNEQATLL